MEKLVYEIFGIFDKNPDKTFTINQLAKKLKKAYPYVFRKVKKLVEGNVLNKKTYGKASMISLNLKNDKTKLLLSTYAASEKDRLFKKLKVNIREAILEFTQRAAEKPSVLSVILFGSYARGTQKEKSDLDLLIIVVKADKETRNFVSGISVSIEMKYGVKTNAITLNVKSIEDMLKKEEVNVGKEALNNHIILHGAENYWRIVGNVF